MKRFFLLLFSVFYCFFLNGNPNKMKYNIDTRIIGKYNLSENGKKIITVKVDRITFPDLEAVQGNSSDISLYFVDSLDNILYRKNFSYEAIDHSINIFSSTSLFFKGVGNTIVVFFNSYPCDGGSGNIIQLFGLSSIDYLVPYTGEIKVHINNYYDINNYFNVRYAISAFKVSKLDFIDKVETNAGYKFFLEAIESSGYCGFNIYNYYELSKEGSIYEKYYDKVDLEVMQITTQHSNRIVLEGPETHYEDGDFINFYTKTDVDNYEKVTITKGMVIEFIKGIKVNNKIWILIKIDNKEGFVLMGDIWKFGFAPFC